MPFPSLKFINSSTESPKSVSTSSSPSKPDNSPSSIGIEVDLDMWRAASNSLNNCSPLFVPNVSGHKSTAEVMLNKHPMVTRLKAASVKHKAFLVDLSSTKPASMKEALSFPHWKATMEEEYGALMRNSTWSLVDSPKHGKTVRCKGIFKIKSYSDRSIQRYQARLEAKGFW